MSRVIEIVMYILLSFSRIVRVCILSNSRIHFSLSLFFKRKYNNKYVPMKYILFLSMLLLFPCYGCDKEPIPPPITPVKPITTNTNLEIVWHVPFYSDSFPDFFWDPVFSNDYVIFTNTYDMKQGHERGVGVYHKATGKRHPAWQRDPGGIIDDVESLRDCQIGGVNENTVYLSTANSLYAYDIHTGNRLWRYKHSPYYGSLLVSVFGKDVLHNYGPGALSKSWYKIAKFDNASGNKTNIVQLFIENNYKFLIETPAWTTNKENDTLLLFLTSGWNFDKVDGKVNAYCYNMTKQEMVWEKKGFTNDKDATKYAPLVIENNKVIFQSLRAIHCMDIASGELVWQHEYLDNGTSATRLLYYNDKLFFRMQSGDIYCYEPQTGQIVWSNTSIEAFPAPDGRMDAYKDKLYLTAYPAGGVYLYCLSISTGELLWKDKGPAEVIQGGVIIDQKTGYLYCHSDWSVMCIDLNKSPKKTVK